MVTVIDVVCRMENYRNVEVTGKSGTLFIGSVRDCKEHREVHRLIVDTLIPSKNKILITTMNH